jgi:hypothetical protein
MKKDLPMITYYKNEKEKYFLQSFTLITLRLD